MRRSPGAAPVGASDRKVSLPIGRCDGGARGTRGRASYVASSTRTRSLRGLDAVSVAPRHRFARADAAFLLRRSPAAPLDGSLFRRWSSLSLRPAALAVLFSPSSLSLSLSVAPTRHSPRGCRASRVSRPSSLAPRASSRRWHRCKHTVSALGRLTDLSTAVRTNRRRRESLSCDALVTGCRSWALRRVAPSVLATRAATHYRAYTFFPPRFNREREKESS